MPIIQPGMYIQHLLCAKSFTFYILMIFFSTVSRHSTSKLTWSECMDFSDTQRYIVSDLEGLKKFLSQGLHLRIEEEKVKKNKVYGVKRIDAKCVRTHVLSFDILGPIMACSF